MTKNLTLHEKAQIRVAAECLIRYKNKILLQKRPDTVSNFPGFWTLPGGHIDYGEDALTTVIREIKEETGLVISAKNTQLKVSAINHHISKEQIWIIYGFRSDLNKFKNPINTEEGDCKWFDIDWVLESKMIFPPIQYYLQYITENKPGMLFMSAIWENSQLKDVQTHLVTLN